MKKNYLIVSLVQTFIIIASALLFPVTANSQDLTEAQRQERCQNNKNRLAELEAQLKNINADLTQAWTKKEIDTARSQMVYVKWMKINANLTNDIINKVNKLNKIGGQYNFNPDECVESKDRFTGSYKECLTKLEKIIATKIDQALSLNRPELLTKKAEIEKQIANHRNNLLKWACDDINKNNTEEFIKKLVGGWKDKPTPWGTPGGDCQIKYANGKLSLVNENNDESGASISVNSDGSAVISASKWPVNGKVDKTAKSIKWSNGTEWVR